MIKALIWDVDGTLAESERDGHRVAFNLAFEACGLPWRWDVARYGTLLRISGGRERLLHDMHLHSDAPVLPGPREALARDIHARKNRFYGELVAGGGIALRAGVLDLLQECRSRGVLLAIATTTSRVNVEALLSQHLGTEGAAWFCAIVCGEDVVNKKPDPQVYQLVLEAMNIGPLAAVAIEDSPGGVAAARAADVPVIVTRSAYFAEATVEGAIAIGPGFDRREGWRPLPVGGSADDPIRLDDIIDWHARMELVSHYE